MRKRFSRSVKPFFIGMAVFAVFQLFTRIPLLQAVLPLTGWFQQMAQIPWLYSLFLGLTAGIFEETGRYLAFRFVLKKERRFEDGLLFGLGHAGMEMIALLGLTYLNNILLALMLNSGMLDTLPGLDAAAIELLTQQLSGITLPLIGVALYERLVTLALHMGFSVLVLYSVRAKRPVRMKEKSDSGVQVSYAVKEAIIDNWIATQKQYEKDDPKIVYYMSMEFLMGRALGNNLINMTAYKEVGFPGSHRPRCPCGSPSAAPGCR